MSVSSNDTLESYTIEGEVSADSETSDDDVDVVCETQARSSFVSRFGFLNHQVDADDRLPFDEDDEPVFRFWSKENDDIHVGMAFKNKAECMFAIRLWNIKHGREIIMDDTRPKYILVKCFTRSKNYKGPEEPFPCLWSATGSSRNKYGVWRVSKWVNNHNCYGHVRNSNNRCLTSSLIARDIDGQIHENMAYPVKHIQTHIRDTWNVEISYAKAWNARRISIERLFGTWESNFADLPKYIRELIHTNPETVVQFDHGASSSTAETFKFIFWAFGPAIRAFQHCVPIICVDGTHLKGSYKGKMLTAVTKNANGNILPVAFAIVDEESNESWLWFLTQFRNHVCRQSTRALCVISDRHQGILNAVNQFSDIFHHRYCLRHVRSNFNKHFKDHQLKRLCWIVGSTTQPSTYKWAIREIKSINPDAWKYLKDIDPKRWALIRDEDHRRWGNLTTNIAESLNNVLRYARLMPIKACIEYTFDYTRKHFIKQYDDASNWNSPLSRKMWKIFKLREEKAASHRVTPYNTDSGVYNVSVVGERSGDGTNQFIVKFEESKCSCGRWQNQRMPCDHVIAACGQRVVDASKLMSGMFTTKRWIHQYKAKFSPLRDTVYWADSQWVIKANPSRLITHRGRRQARRIRNEMDDPENRRRKRPTCRICNGEGHNRSTCPNRG